MKPIKAQNLDGLAIFGGNAHPDLARAVTAELGVTLGQADVGSFNDGEARIAFNDDVRGKDVFIIQPTGQPDRNAVELELMIMSIRSSAKCITAVIPYFGYARQDRRDRPRVPISVLRSIRNLVATGVDRVVLMDLHSSQIVGEFEAINPRVGVDHLYARPVVLDWLSAQNLDRAIVSPVDSGGSKTAESYMTRLHKMGFPVEFGNAHKSGSSASGIFSLQLLGDFSGRHAFFIDDMASTAKTLTQATREAQRLGASEITSITIHPVLASTEACQRIADSPITRFVTTNSLPIREESQQILGDKLVVLSLARLLALAIEHLHNNKSMSALFELDGYRAG